MFTTTLSISLQMDCVQQHQMLPTLRCCTSGYLIWLSVLVSWTSSPLGSGGPKDRHGRAWDLGTDVFFLGQAKSGNSLQSVHIWRKYFPKC